MQTRIITHGFGNVVMKNFRAGGVRGWRAHAQNGVILYALSRASVIFPRYKLLETDDRLGSLHTSVDRKDVW